MSMLHRFIDQLKARGLKVVGPKPGEADDSLHVVGPTAEVTPRVLHGLKVFKPHLVKLYGRAQAEPEAPPPIAEPPRGEFFGRRRRSRCRRPARLARAAGRRGSRRRRSRTGRCSARS